MGILVCNRMFQNVILAGITPCTISGLVGRAVAICTVIVVTIRQKNDNLQVLVIVFVTTGVERLLLLRVLQPQVSPC